MKLILFTWTLAAFSVASGARAEENLSKKLTTKPAVVARVNWDVVTTPTSGPTKIIGETAAGCLMGAHALPKESTDYVLVRPSRRAFYGTPELISYVESLAKRVHEATKAPMIVEDLSRPRGGPYSAGHGSHQTGLDVDVSLTVAREPMTSEAKESFASPSFVKDRKILKSEWGDTQVKIISLAAEDANVDRIFVSPAIKKYFCEKFPKEAWSFKLRAWWGHEEHIHVRLKCPSGQTSCIKQAPLNSKDPCGKDQQWWQTPAADKEWQAMQTEWTKGLSKAVPKRLPKECETLSAAI